MGYPAVPYCAGLDAQPQDCLPIVEVAQVHCVYYLRLQAVEEDWVESWLSGHKEADQFVHPRDGSADEPTMSLFAFPAEENYSGKLYPLRWIREIQVRQFALDCSKRAALCSS